MKKYFDFNGTINGTNYFLRNLLLAIPAVFANAFITSGSYEGSGAALVLIVFFAFLFLLAAFSFSTINKRLNALMPDNKILGWILMFIPVVSSIMGLYLIFANSKIEEHNG